MNLPGIVNDVPKHLNTIAKNKTLKEFTALCSASASIFFFGLTLVILRAKPTEDPMAVNNSSKPEEAIQDSSEK